MILGCAVIAVTRRTGRERVLLLKGVGLGLLLVAGRKTGDTWLLITSKTRPTVLDQYVATADHALGNPSWLVGRIVKATGPVGSHVLDFVYIQLAVAAVIVALYQLRNVAVERRFPGHHLVRTFLVIGLLGPAIYMIFPVVGPIFAYGAGASAPAASTGRWPTCGRTRRRRSVPRTRCRSTRSPHATACPACTRRGLPRSSSIPATGPRVLRFAGTFWLIATLAATLGFGYHYGADLIAGVVFTLTIEAALRSLDRGWDRSGIRLVAYGATVFAALLVSYRYLPLEMARHPWVFGPLLLLAMASVVYGYVRTDRLWETEAAPARQPEPQPERHPERHPELVRVPQPFSRSRSSSTSAKNHV